MKTSHGYFIHHLRSYRMFYFMFFTFVLLITSILIHTFWNSIYAAWVQKDLLEQAFEPAIQQETIINLGAGKNAVGNEFLREWVNIQNNVGQWCFVNNERVGNNDLDTQMWAYNYTWSREDFCSDVLGWDRDTTVLKTEAPLIVRIAKFLLRITMVLAVTMVIFNGIMWIIESAKWAEVKDAKKNITLIVVGILIALMSLGIINLISSLTVSSLWTSSTTVDGSCSINGTVLAGDDLKKYICENDPNIQGTRYDDRVGNRCKSGNDREAINEKDTIDGCITLGWTYNN